MSKKPLKVVELFAGVGGFRVALEGYPKQKNSKYEVMWSNQFEPKTKKQHASLVYKARWKDALHSDIDIEKVIEHDFKSIPHCDVLVGGFPCQDFSVANRTHNHGLEGSKGKLWFAIIDIIRKQGKHAPKYLFFENVDRLLISPAKQRGRDFAVILSSLNALGYAVEWRVINAADYGFPQRRRRVYFLAYKKGTKLFKELVKAKINYKDWLVHTGIMAKSFTCTIKGRLQTGSIPNAIKDIMLNFSNEANRFNKAGVMINGTYYTCDVEAIHTGKKQVLKDILLNNSEIPTSFFITEEELLKWKKKKGAKIKKGINQKTGLPYIYREGNVPFPDDIHKPARTIITKEGGRYVSREKHVVCINGKYRRLHPIELERLNGFPDNHTQLDGITDTQRAFFMGNALVVGIVQKIGKQLAKFV